MCNKSRADRGEETSYSPLMSVLLDFSPLVAKKTQTFINQAFFFFFFQRDCGQGLFSHWSDQTFLCLCIQIKFYIKLSCEIFYCCSCGVYQIVASPKDQDSGQSEDVFFSLPWFYFDSCCWIKKNTLNTKKGLTLSFYFAQNVATSLRDKIFNTSIEFISGKQPIGNVWKGGAYENT